MIAVWEWIRRGRFVRICVVCVVVSALWIDADHLVTGHSWEKAMAAVSACVTFATVMTLGIYVCLAWILRGKP
jgi:hypothetical protein